MKAETAITIATAAFYPFVATDEFIRKNAKKTRNAIEEVKCEIVNRITFDTIHPFVKNAKK